MADETKNGEDKGYKPEFEIVEEGDEGKAKAADGGDKAKTGYEDDTRLSAEQRADDAAGDDDDTAVALDEGNQTAEQIEAKREKRRRERKAQKVRQNEARRRDGVEMTFLRTRNEQLERKFGSLEQRVQQNEITQVDGRMEQLKAAIVEAEEVLGRAIEANDGAGVVKLQRTIRQLEEGKTRLTNYKHALSERAKAEAAEDEGGEEGGQDQQRRGAPEQLTAVVANNLKTFAKRHPWFDLDNGDEDSLIVAALDNAVKRDGFNPASKDYWVELEERMKRRLPDRMKTFEVAAADDADDEDDEPPARANGKAKDKDKPKGGPRMATGSQTRGNGKQFLLSAERKQAMIEAGVWDDPELRDKYIASYARYDKENPAQSGR